MCYVDYTHYVYHIFRGDHKVLHQNVEDCNSHSSEVSILKP